MKVHSPVVVGVDGSQSATDAAWWAAECAVARGAPLKIVTTMYVPGSYAVPIGMPPEFYDEQETAAKERLSAAAAHARLAAGEGLSIDTDLFTGPATATLLSQSETASMLVVGSRGLGEFTGGLLGSVSSAVVGHARCPVAVVKALAEPEGVARRPVVVGVDGTRNSEPAIAEAYLEASLRKADLIAVHAWSDLTLPPRFSDDGLDWEPIQSREAVTLSESLAGYADDYPDVHVHPIVVRQEPVRSLLEYSRRAQLVVVGSRGRGGFASMLLGSTSRALLHSISCPLLIVRA
ncbi:universal stress protein [Rhodococcus maanshanensis]|uniref:universal stress protein n=1 Tax=Rhodococcus maanshanensis TaxID=183556 RepID=UPI0022B5A60F|nr:universal stress protein [Rhodococcus maanshanensis]MCZ4558733.1 universal stress protein [Rhodococcus maanshanensis]